MTTVEELRVEYEKDVMADIKELATNWGDSEYMTERRTQRMKAELDSLISAASTEGAEQERERIRKTAQVWLTGDPPPNDTWYGVDKKELDPSALAPTKESEK